jgi:hypothetical protein
MQRAPRGSYESEPRDAQVVAAWGAISWRGSMPSGTDVEITTRSGNTPTPDDTWSAWSPAYKDRSGSPIVSPKARYLQWRAVLNGKNETPILTSVTAAYLQRNLRRRCSRLRSIRPASRSEALFDRRSDLARFGNQTTPERKLTNSAMTARAPVHRRSAVERIRKGCRRWCGADDDNGDDLSYQVRYRREGETTWRVLREDLRDEILVWDTTTVPNGTYFVNIVASDAPSNAPDTALAGERDSVAFEIDNTPPQVTIQSVRTDGARPSVTFEVIDDHSPILRVGARTTVRNGGRCSPPMASLIREWSGTT